ncbi:MAG: hypothetical protein J6Y36_03010 [Treponema sp.]|uniref:prephenate dehydratase n=1 Tax=Treponema sp. TaxID=166 RepID=UPI001B5A6EFC|nr:prephenate dehydratase domain-containing protein [Treponema sp.]MBP5402111.1 hypothetical protein [Treponema sp.]MBR5933446.1 hypothetical protein [Treponema sp.]
MKIAYSGIEGAFAYIAAKKIFPGEELCAFSDFRTAYESVEKGECDYAVLPIENSYAGEVGQVTDLMFQGNLFVNSVYTLNVVQNLLGIKGSDINSIKKVISHSQALDQCAEFIAEHNYAAEEAVNTARAAKQVADSGDKTTAAIASEETASLYGLEVLASGINGQRDNSTRFAILSKNEKQLSPAAGTFILMFAVKNEAGALVKVLNKLGEFGCNMSVIHSRPLKGLAWSYYFYIEADGEYGTPAYEQMLSEMRYRCDKLKVLGTF